MKTADIIIPVFNECDGLPLFFQRLHALHDIEQFNIIVVDNGSTDGSAEYLQAMSGITVIVHDHNLGYGASLRRGMLEAITDRWIIIDADGEYPPECIPLLLQALSAHAVVYASRLLGKRTAHSAGMPALQWWGNRMISSLYNGLFAQGVTDLYTGCKALRREAIDNIILQRNGFEHVLELGVMLSMQGKAIAEIPVDFSPRQYGVSKMSHVTETAKYFFWLLRYKIEAVIKSVSGNRYA